MAEVMVSCDKCGRRVPEPESLEVWEALREPGVVPSGYRSLGGPLHVDFAGSRCRKCAGDI